MGLGGEGRALEPLFNTTVAGAHFLVNRRSSMAMRWFLCGVLLLMSGLVVACGIPQDQYDVVVSDLGVAQQELQSVKTELEAAQGKVSEVTSSLEKARTELKTTQAELEAAKSKLETAQAELKTAQSDSNKAQVDFKEFKSDIKSLWLSQASNIRVNNMGLEVLCASLRKDTNAMFSAAPKVTAAVADLKDLKAAELKGLWEEVYVLEGGKRYIYHKPFASFMELNRTRIIMKGRALTAKLTE